MNRKPSRAWSEVICFLLTFLATKLANSAKSRSGAINDTWPDCSSRSRRNASTSPGSGSTHFAATLQSTTKTSGTG